MSTPLSYDDPRRDGGHRYPAAQPGRGPGARPFIGLTAAAALAGGVFGGISSSDFISHLDRQVHSIHCSFIPGAAAEIGESGCRTAMMSPYSSVLREAVWGGIPVALLAVAVFAYLVMHAGRLLLSQRPVTRHETLYLVAATLLPVLTSVVFGVIAVEKLGALCKLCVGIYVASGVAFAGALLAHVNAAPATSGALPMGLYARQFGEGVLYVGILTVFYVLFVPASPKSLQGCGTLVKKDEPGVLIPMGEARRGATTPAVAVLDPLCPSCKAFDDRLKASDLHRQLAVKVALFPLDASCNWMVTTSLHPGACAVSEAMLCDHGRAEQVLGWAFEHQEELRRVAKEDDARVRARIEERFPHVRGCLGSAKIKNQVNKSLRWAVANALPVLTPQLFVNDTRVCDEDTDLGLEFTLSKMLAGAQTSAKR